MNKRLQVCLIVLMFCGFAYSQPQSQEAVQAKVEKDRVDETCLIEYQRELRSAASRLLSKQIRSLKKYKVDLIKTRNNITLRKNKEDSELVKKVLEQELQRIEAEVKKVETDIKEKTSQRRNLNDWKPKVPNIPIPEDVDKTPVPNQLADLELPEGVPSYTMRQAAKGEAISTHYRVQKWVFKPVKAPRELRDAWVALPVQHIHYKKPFIAKSDGFLVIATVTAPNFIGDFIPKAEKVEGLTIVMEIGQLGTKLTRTECEVYRREVKKGETLIWRKDGNHRPMILFFQPFE